MYAGSRPTSLIYLDGREVKESKRIVPFQVHGKTYDEALKSAVAYVASKTPLKNSDAWTHTEMQAVPKGIKEEVAESNGLSPVVASIEVTSVTVNLNIQENIPEWVEYDSATPTDQAAWQAKLADTKPHEEGHAAIAEEGAHELDKKLPGTRGVGAGSDKAQAKQVAEGRLKAAYKQKVNDQAAKTKAEQTAWDEKAKKEHNDNSK
jgi:predicted secreted Zn-dependent protease